jgi:hypothetical protein
VKAQTNTKAFQTDRRGLLCGLAAIPAAAAISPASATSSTPADPDPIFAAIEAHRLAEAQVESEAARAMLIQPSTLQGCVALLTYFGGRIASDELAFPTFDRDDDDKEALPFTAAISLHVAASLLTLAGGTDA